MTPCERLGYKVGDRFEVVSLEGEVGFYEGELVALACDDGSDRPLFERATGHGEDYFCYLSQVRPVADKPVTLNPGDYVSTEGMDEATYHKVAEAFMAAGAGEGEYPEPMWIEDDMGDDWAFGWWKTGDLWHGVEGCFRGRHLTIAQVLGATNAGSDTQQEHHMDLITTLKQARQARDEAESAYQDALSAVRAELGYGFTLDDNGAQAGVVRDLPPEEWRAGDMFTPTRKGACHRWWIEGKTYEAKVVDGELKLRDGDGEWRRLSHVIGEGYVRFHSRP